ncbi:MAG: ATP-binding cassette domain-containing protein [Bacteroidia bacterium]|nr:ATP-binding cassette domain-containing protein [Bacteroidia bacterium]
MNLQNFISEEIEGSLRNNDQSLLTRRLMDICEEFKLNTTIRTAVFELRRSFLTNENNLNRVSEDSFSEKALAIIEQIREADFEMRELRENTDELVIDAEQISKEFNRGRNPFTLYPLDVKLKQGEITGVVGENGNGKTTLLRLLAGELSLSSGKLNYPALTNLSDSWYEVKNRLAYIPQRIDRWYGTLEDNLKFFATIHGFTGAENNARIEFILYRLGLEKFRDLKWTEISSGYRLRFELAKMLLWKPKLLLLDEPLANLDINAQQLLLQDLQFFSRSKTHPISIVLTSQNLHEIEKVADNLIFIRQGKTIYNGAQNLFALDRSQNSFELSGNFDVNALRICFNNIPGISIESSGTSFIVNTSTQLNIYDVMTALKENKLELNYVRDISQSTRKLFHKDI